MDVLEKIKKENYNKWKNKPELLQELKDWLEGNTNINSNGLSKQEMIFLIRNEYKENPICPVCKIPIKFEYNKYRKYCSSKCSANSNTTLERRKKTVKNKYGCENVFQSEKIKDKIKETNLDKYGDENPYKIGSDNFKKRMKMIHGVENASQLDWVKEHNKRVEFDKTYEGLYRFSDKVLPLFDKKHYNGCGYDKVYRWKCLACNKEFSAWYHNGWLPQCTHCIKNSKFQDEVEEYINSLGISYTTNDRMALSGLELDIYSNQYKIGIECNGNYWHLESNGKHKKYHISKTKKCEDAGIRLIHIFEDEWILKRNIVKSRLRHIFQFNRKKIYGRKCEIRKIEDIVCERFLNKYHIQGSDKSSIKLGAFYENRLVAVMTFSKRRFDKREGYELVRYATISSFSCIGVAGKLLKHFERNYNPKSIISYADLRWSKGNLYQSLGFDHIHNSTSAFYYMKGNYLHRLSRIAFQKHKLQSKLDKFDPSLSEWENMKANGYDRIWDCGNMVFEKTY